jgi:hypothetical protein
VNKALLWLGRKQEAGQIIRPRTIGFVTQRDLWIKAVANYCNSIKTTDVL